jgi:hypothetical protein
VTEKTKLCPRCLKDYDEYPALSRMDNKTDICSKCGNQEAMLDYIDLEHLPSEQIQQTRMFCERIGSSFDEWLEHKQESLANQPE